MKDRKTRYDKVLSKLPDTLEWGVSQDISSAKAFLLEADGLPRVFLGSGGSLSAALFATQLSVERGIIGVAMTPYQYIFSAWEQTSSEGCDNKCRWQECGCYQCLQDSTCQSKSASCSHIDVISKHLGEDDGG